MSRVLATFAMLLTVLFLAGSAEADAVGICEPDLPGQCFKTISYTAGSTSLLITLQNTAPAGGGFIVGDAFDIPGTVNVLSIASTNPAFFLTPGPITVNPAPQLGLPRDFLISITGDFEGGGSPNSGIPVGGSATFTLTLSGPIVGFTTEDVLLTQMNEAIRVRGATIGEGSDKDLIVPGGVIPEPTTLLLVGSGLMGLAHVARRRKQR